MSGVEAGSGEAVVACGVACRGVVGWEEVLLEAGEAVVLKVCAWCRAAILQLLLRLQIDDAFAEPAECQSRGGDDRLCCHAWWACVGWE